MRRSLGKSVEPRYADRRPGEIEHITIDIGKAKRLLEWSPKINLEEGARKTAEYFSAVHHSKTVRAAAR